MARKRMQRQGEPELLERLYWFADQDTEDPAGRYGYGAFVDHAIRYSHSGFGHTTPSSRHWRDKEDFLMMLRADHQSNTLPLQLLRGAVIRLLSDLAHSPAWLTVSENHLQKFLDLAREYKVRVITQRYFWDSGEELSRDGRDRLLRDHMVTQRKLADGTEEWIEAEAAGLRGPAAVVYGTVCLAAIKWLERIGKCWECGKRLDPENSNVNKRFCCRAHMLAYNRRPEVKARRAAERSSAGPVPAEG